ncbi:hypothetical protein CTEN210_00896 [Chaetoceros tenuissimus]|uniref:SGNH hydrolase-type esterase domain-containing protein n=1 Tax=Chaetoceros tenuissimus TaxID=426638 RepID=A0AAD3CE39_9STRA|nr:hypothetical protein CTEN210_00896 [Chaetoceros tenuissimus]
MLMKYLFLCFGLLSLAIFSIHQRQLLDSRGSSTASPLFFEEDDHDETEDEKNEILKNEIKSLKDEIENLKRVNEKLVEKDISLRKHVTGTTGASDEIENLKRENEKLVQAERTSSRKHPSSSTRSSLFPNKHVCSILEPSFSASIIWNQSIESIYQASHIPHLQKEFPTLTKGSMEALKLKKILHQLSPLFERGMIHLPSTSTYTSNEILKTIFDKIQKIHEDTHSDPLQIVVLGGSVTRGRGCYGHNKNPETRPCAWPRRLELLINQFFERKVVQITNLAIGGTNTAGIGSKLVKNWMYPTPELKKNGPDIIINGYSTNDALPALAQIANITDPEVQVMTSVHDAVQDFIIETFYSKSCAVPPLVVFTDDYLGPQQDLIRGELSYNSAVTSLAKWYDFMFLSYADVVRDLAYGNMTDDTFSNFQNDVHFGRWAHQSIAWTLGYGALNLMTKYCSEQYHKHSYTIEKNDRVYLPPPLTKDLLLKNITTEVIAAKEKTAIATKCDTTSVDHNPCPLAWISSPGIYDWRNMKHFLQTHQTENSGWNAENNWANGGHQGKFGIVSTHPNSSINLSFDGFQKDINTMTITRLVSYGEKWKDSRARFILNIGTETIATEEISGVHDFKYSLTLPQTVTLRKVIPKGQPFTLKVDLIGGTMFKILGMSLCKY